MKLTSQSEVGKIQNILLKHPKDAFRNQTYIDSNWQDLNYLGAPNFNKACAEYDAFVQILVDNDIEVRFLASDNKTGMDSLYVRDASIITDKGVYICNMGKSQRSDEPGQQMEYYGNCGMQIIDQCRVPGMVEGGDVAWLNDSLLAIAHGYRTNIEGINQIKESMQGSGVDVLIMDSPHYKGPSDVFHLMSVLSPVDKNLAVVYSPLMTVPFRNQLINLGIEFIEVPDEEFDSLGCNILAIGPRRCLMVKGNPKTRALLEQAGTEVIEFEGDEICLKGSGGPTCLTRPLDRVI